jgi:hypothetical protein
MGQFCQIWTVLHDIFLQKFVVQRVICRNIILLDAQRNTSALSTQMERCYCETHQRIDTRASETNQLIREVDAGRVRDKLNRVELENVALRLRYCKSPTTP